MLAGVSGFEWAWIYYGHRPFARGNLQSHTLDLVTQVNLVRGKSLRSSHSDVAGRRRSVQPGRGRPGRDLDRCGAELSFGGPPLTMACVQR